jgi:hypothetical protein
MASERFPANYFKRPFPTATGFSPYRTPGMLVHLPVIALFAWLGYICCLERTWLTPFAAAYLLAGVYVGRDAAIAAHYNMFIALGVWAICLVVICNPWNVSIIVVARLRGSLGLQCLATVSVMLVLVFNMWWWRRRYS